MKKIYIYETPKSKENGFIKIGETSKDNVEDRIKEQFSSAALYDNEDCRYTILFETIALRSNGDEFSDKDLHQYFEENNVFRPNKRKEWFQLTLEQAVESIKAYQNFKEKQHNIFRIHDFVMRKEQEKAVELTFNYFSKNKGFNQINDFLWNAKMRFGKTFTAYQLMKKSNWSKVLVITYRPAVKKSWRDDLNTHKDFSAYNFLSNDDIIKINKSNNDVVFVSFQDLLQSKDNFKERHKLIFDNHWDCIIIDEFHYGTSTENARSFFEGYSNEDKKEIIHQIENDELIQKEKELREEFDIIENTLPQLKTKNRLYLSGTPFKAVSSNRFSNDKIFNWSYVDEQREKSLWFEKNENNDKEKNPYYSLPQLNMFIYEISDENFKKGVDKKQDEFSLSYFFRTKQNKFEDESAVKNWLDIISGKVMLGNNDLDFETNSNVIRRKSKFPFANEEDGGLAHILKHTFWLMPNVSACNAMSILLNKHNVFQNYYVVVAAGTKFGVGADAIPPVEQAISTKSKTITLSCGKLTEGVSIKEWTAVLFLTDISSPERYFQTAFRAQTPWKENGKTIKTDCYVFDFHPSRSLRLLAEYSNKLAKDPNKKMLQALVDKKESLAEFIRYLPVLKISGNYMSELNSTHVISYDCSNYNSTDLIKAFQSLRNIDVSKDLVADLLINTTLLNKCDAILDNIKAYRKFMGYERDTTTIKELGDETKKIEHLKTKELKEKETVTRKEIQKEIREEEKKLKDKQDKLRELLKVLLGRIPLFMYLTHAIEEDLLEVLNNTQSGKLGLFRQVTGIEIEDFEFLMACGIIKSESIDSYIQRFKEIELLNYQSDNELF